MARTTRLLVRDFDNGFAGPPPGSNMTGFIILLLAFVTLSLCCMLVFVYFHRKRQTKKGALLPTHRKSSHHRTLSISTIPYSGSTRSVFVYNERRDLIANSSSPPASPIPEIRITFPEEEDANGSKKDGKVVVVRISETGSVGMEPPPYQSVEQEGFHSLDLDRIGGLKE